MKLTKTITVSSEDVIGLECDVCKNKYEDIFEMQEFISLDFTGGYGSVIGDGVRCELDICQSCFKSAFENFYRLSNQD